MTVSIRLSCGGCSAEADGVVPIRRNWEPVFGGSICRAVETPVTDATPAGWVMFDPYTAGTYCPSCWADIEGDEVPS